MFIRRQLFLFILALGLFNASAFAQTETSARSAQAKSSAAAVTAASNAGGGVRFTAPAEALQLRLELYAAGGERVFDSGLRAGNVLDWQSSDAPQGLGDVYWDFKNYRGQWAKDPGSLLRSTLIPNKASVRASLHVDD